MSKLSFLECMVTFSEREPILRKFLKSTFAPNLSKMCLAVAPKTNFYASIETLNRKYLDEPKYFPEA